MANGQNPRPRPEDLLSLNIGAISGAFAQQSERAFKKGQTFLKGAEGLRVAREKTEASQALNRIADNVMKLYDAYLESEEDVEERRVKTEAAKRVARQQAAPRILSDPAIEVPQSLIQPTSIIEPSVRPTLSGEALKGILGPFTRTGETIGQEAAGFQQVVRQAGYEPDFISKLVGFISGTAKGVGEPVGETVAPTAVKRTLLQQFPFLSGLMLNLKQRIGR